MEKVAASLLADPDGPGAALVTLLTILLKFACEIRSHLQLSESHTKVLKRGAGSSEKVSPTRTWPALHAKIPIEPGCQGAQ